MKLKDSIILILAVIIAIIVGVLVGVKLTENKDNNENNPNNNVNNEETVKPFSIAEALALMGKYKECGTYIVTLNEESKVQVVFGRNVDGTLADIPSKIVPCNDKSLDEVIDQNEIKNGSCYIIDTSQWGVSAEDNIAIHGYQDVLNIKKQLFGPNETLERKDYYGGNVVKYSKKTDSFVYANGDACVGLDLDHENQITSAEQIGEKVKIVVSTVETDYGLGDEPVVSKYTYEYIFKKANNNYYLAEINKLA